MLLCCPSPGLNDARYETATETIKLAASLELPVLINVIEIDEYYPDYYNEFGGSGEDEFKPTINNREIVIGWRNASLLHANTKQYK